MNSENDTNRQKTYDKSIFIKAGVRNPLADLRPNEKILNVRKVTRSISTVKSLKPRSDKNRTNSATDVETRVKFAYKSENITERKKDNEIVNDFDEVFVEGEEHFVKYLPEKRSSSIQGKIELQDERAKIEQPLPLVRVSRAVSEEVRKPAKKLSLVRKLSCRSKRARNEEMFRNCLYDEEYFEDNYSYMLTREKKFVYRRTYLVRYADQNYRLLCVNWLIYAQQLLNLSENTFFAAVRMFDYLLITMKFSWEKYNLLGIVCLWIANKTFDVHYIQVPKIFAICGGKFSRRQILTKEVEVLRSLKFNVNFPEPLTFLYYYLKHENLETNSKVRNSAMFILELFTLLLDFSSLSPSFLASAALYIVLLKYDITNTSFLSHVEKYILDVNAFKHKSDQLNSCVKELLKCERMSKELVAKYSTEDRCKIAHYFTTDIK